MTQNLSPILSAWSFVPDAEQCEKDAETNARRES
jgi:hypothetical protein